MRISDWSSDVCSSDLLTLIGRADASVFMEPLHSVLDAAAGVKAVAMLAMREGVRTRSEEHTSELQSLMRISYAVFCLKKKNKRHQKSELYKPQHKTSTKCTRQIPPS